MNLLNLVIIFTLKSVSVSSNIWLIAWMDLIGFLVHFLFPRSFQVAFGLYPDVNIKLERFWVLLFSFTKC